MEGKIPSIGFLGFKFSIFYTYPLPPESVLKDEIFGSCQGSKVTKPTNGFDGLECNTNNHYCPVGSKAEYACEPGTYQNSKKQSKCNNCTNGEFCPGGDVIKDEPLLNGANCQLGDKCKCQEGHFCPANAVFPIPCPKGTYGRVGATNYNKVFFEK